MGKVGLGSQSSTSVKGRAAEWELLGTLGIICCPSSGSLSQEMTLQTVQTGPFFFFFQPTRVLSFSSVATDCNAELSLLDFIY